MKEYVLNEQEKEYFKKIADEIVTHPNFVNLKNQIAHGKTTVYEHCIMVALESYKYALSKRLLLDYPALIRGALLHDYYFYDWHKNKPFTFHGLKHNHIALKNAKHDFSLSKREKDIIINHMFPLTIFHFPKSKEAWIVCRIDKKVALLDHKKIKQEQKEKIYE